MNQSPSQHWQAQSYAEHARFVADYGTPLLELLSPQPHERILDLGCGDGVLTQQIAQTGCKVVGLDGSADFVAAARGLGIDAVLGDGQQLDFDQEFDAVFSNAALHWMVDAEAVVRGMARALKKGGRLVAEFGGEGNIATIQTALTESLAAHGLQPRPCWYFPSENAYRTLLEKHGFNVQHIGLYPRPTPLPTGMAGWLATFAAPILPANINNETRRQVLERTVAMVEQVLPKENGQTVADYMRLRVLAVKAV